MKRQQGQSLVEFALIAPLLFLMIFGMIWAGFMFMEYLHFSNQVRTVARQIAVTNAKDRTDDLLATYKQSLTDYYEQSDMPKIYEPTPDINWDTGDVVVTVYFEMKKDAYESLPNILKNEEDFAYGVGFPPKKIKTIEYRMHLERGVTTSNDTTNTNTDDTSTTETPAEG